MTRGAASRGAGKPKNRPMADSQTTGNSAISAALVARGVRRALGDLGYATVTELALVNGRRADVVGIDRRGEIVMVEIKVSLADLRADLKWPEYRDCCDALYFAIPPGFPDSAPPAEAGLLVADGFGAGVNGPLVIAVDASADRAVVETLTAAVAADPGIASVAPPEFSTDGAVATLVAIPSTPPQDAATMDTVERLRTEVFPAALRNSPATAHVGGQTATWGDLGGRVGDRLPWFIAAVVLLSFLLLMVALGLTGVLWQNVTQRMREIGLRRAKGATTGRIHRQILGEVAILTSLAVAVGAAVVVQFPLLDLLGFVSAGVFASSLVLSAAAIYVLALLCALHPGRLATRIHPAEALHYE